MIGSALALVLSSILVFNQDDGQFLSEVRTPQELCGYLDTVLRGKVTHFFMCPNAQRCNIPSDVFEPCWLALEEKPERIARRGKPWALKTMFDRGIDPYAVWISHCRKKGVSPWITMRMNDVHSVDNPDYGGLSRFWKENPQFRRNPSAPLKNWGEHAFDYSHREVRDFHLAFVRTCLERYDIDGFEADWMRFPLHFRKGREAEDARYLTEFMREVRRLADAAAVRLGHPVLISARVPTDPDGALGIGCDTLTWAKERLVDWIVPCNFLATADMLLPYAEWKKRIHAVNPDVTIVPGLDYAAVKEGGRGIMQPLTAAEYRGFADSVYSEGAPGIYLFNLFVAPKATSAWNPVLSEGLSPAAVAAGERSYYTSYHENSLPGERGFQAPVLLNERRELKFRTCAPLVEGMSVVLHLAFDAAVADDFARSVRLNGVAPVSHREEPKTAWLSEKSKSVFSLRLEFPAEAFKRGMNIVSVPAAQGITLRAGELELKRRR